MKNVRIYLIILFTICNLYLVKSQTSAGVNKVTVIDTVTEDFKLKLSRYTSGKQNLGWEEGDKLFGMGGNISEIMGKLFPEYEWDVDEELLADNYHLRIDYKSDAKSKQEVNQLVLKQVAGVIGANIEKTKIDKQAICISEGSSQLELAKAKDRNAMNKITHVGDDLKIHSVKLQDLKRLLMLNSDYLIKYKDDQISSSRYDFNFNLKNKKTLKDNLSSYGFEVSDCEVEKVLFRLYSI